MLILFVIAVGMPTAHAFASKLNVKLILAKLRACSVGGTRGADTPHARCGFSGFFHTFDNRGEEALCFPSGGIPSSRLG
jgi:hypothetical protein